MRHLLVVCHPRRMSFTQTVAATYAQELGRLGHSVTMRDLYQLGFDPVLRAGELMDAPEPSVPNAVRDEQEHLAGADAVAFFYPLWWAFMPAMMKGYLDRVLSWSFAYSLAGEEMTPRLRGKRALIFTSSGADMTYLEESGQWNAMGLIEKEHILSLCGLELLEHVHFAAIVPDLPKPSVTAHLARVRDAARRHWSVQAALTK